MGEAGEHGVRDARVNVGCAVMVHVEFVQPREQETLLLKVRQAVLRQRHEIIGAHRARTSRAG